MPLRKLTLVQIAEIRKGILLAKHDNSTQRFYDKHQDRDPDLVALWAETNLHVREALVGLGPITDLTMIAYNRTVIKGY